jgi:hypothetical protein
MLFFCLAMEGGRIVLLVLFVQSGRQVNGGCTLQSGGMP